MNQEIDYKKAYELEHEKCMDLSDRIVILESENEDLQFKLDKIKNNAFWKATKPARSMIHFALRQKERLATIGGPKDFLRKVRNKQQQISLMKSYGTDSFPTPEEAARQRETVFERSVKISILVPLWNTPKEFLVEMTKKQSRS